MHATGTRHRRLTNEDPLQSLAWDKHCTASMLAGTRLCHFRKGRAFLLRHSRSIQVQVVLSKQHENVWCGCSNRLWTRQNAFC